MFFPLFFANNLFANQPFTANMPRQKRAKTCCITQTPPGDHVVRMLLGLMPLRSKVRCFLVCKQWKQLAEEQLSEHLDFRNSKVSLLGMCALAVNVRWRRISLHAWDVAETTGVREDVVNNVVRGLKRWDRAENLPLSLNFRHSRVDWHVLGHLRPLLPHVSVLSVGPHSKEAILWAPELKSLVVNDVQLGSVRGSVSPRILPGLKSLCVRSCRTRAIRPLHLREWLCGLRSLTTVEFRGMELSDPCVAAVMAACAAGGWAQLDLESVHMGVLGAHTVASAIADCPSLKGLCLDGNDIRDEGALEVAKGARHLQCLELTTCGITAEGAAAVMEALSEHTNGCVVRAAGSDGFEPSWIRALAHPVVGMPGVIEFHGEL